VLQKVLSAVRRLVGMPDYQGYVTHIRECHPERSVPSEREYYEQYLERRYGAGTSRCC
jgi:uncharacterized short protein YbdD (DUF466 family)